MKRVAIILFFLEFSAVAFADQPVSIGVNSQFPPYPDRVRAANIGWSRYPLPWSRIEPQRGVFNWPDVDVNAFRAQGVKILGMINSVPGWANGNMGQAYTPLTLTDWTEFIHQLATHYAGKIDAYEIWNEPDSSQFWSRSLTQSPTYVDYVHAAWQQIKAADNLALVGGPAFKSDSDLKKNTIFGQIQNGLYSDGPASNCFDFMSFHANGVDQDHSYDKASQLSSSNLHPMSVYCPKCNTKQVWITEFGWKSGAIGEDSQRVRIKNFLIYITGVPYSGTTSLRAWNLNHGFIYKLNGCDESRGIYNCLPAGGPKLVVTQYLQLLPFPATQPTNAIPESVLLGGGGETSNTPDHMCCGLEYEP